MARRRFKVSYWPIQHITTCMSSSRHHQCWAWGSRFPNWPCLTSFTKECWPYYLLSYFEEACYRAMLAKTTSSGCLLGRYKCEVSSINVYLQVSITLHQQPWIDRPFDCFLWRHSTFVYSTDCSVVTAIDWTISLLCSSRDSSTCHQFG